MHIFLLFCLFSIVTGSVLPSSIYSIVPRLSPSLRERDDGFSQVVNVGSYLSDRDADPESQRKTYSLKALKARTGYETLAPPSTRWQGILGSQWDDWHMDVMVKAWRNGKVLAQVATQSIIDISAGSPAYQPFESQAIVVNGICQSMKSDPTRMTPAYLLCYRTFIAANNLAYGQLFGADPANVQLVQSNFQRIVDQTENLAATRTGISNQQDFDRDNQLLYLTWGPTITDNAGNNLCTTGALGKDTQAVTVVASGTKEFAGGSSVPGAAYIIHFCPSFFELARMENQLYALQQNSKQNEPICNLGSLDSTARAVLHEWTHLPWVLNTNYQRNPQECYGFLTATSYAINNFKINQPVFTKSVSTKNADSYAWMAVYNYFNSLDKCQGVRYSGVNEAPPSCKTDIWPPGTAKLVKTQWNNYEAGN